MTEDQKKPIGKITPKKVAAEKSVAARPDAAMADEASPVQQKMEKNSIMQGLERVNARAEGFLISDSDLPMRNHYILFGAVIFLTGMILWASWAKLDEVTRGMGKIIPSSETKVLQSLEGGIVDEFLVREGEQVTKGQILIRLRDIEAASDFGSNEQRYLGTLASVARLQAEAEGLASPVFPKEVMEKVPQSVTEEMNSFKANRNRIQSQRMVVEQQLSQRQQEVNELNTRIADTRGLLSIAREEKNMIAPLVERGSAPRLELLQLDRSIKERQTEFINDFNEAKCVII